MEEREALQAFLSFLGDGVIVGHHIGFDIEILNCAYERHFEIKLLNRWLDAMDLTLHLKDSGAFGHDRELGGFSLDALCAFFGVAPRDRHTAGGDAFITALIFLRLLRLARKSGRTRLGDLLVRYVANNEI
jgi:DNA polymerase-3 subunit epsilon